MKEEAIYIIDQENAGVRIDVFLVSLYPDYTRSYMQKLIEKQYITVNDKTIKSNYKLKVADSVRFTDMEPVAYDICPENIPLDIIYEDDDVLLVNKPKGMVVHPCPGHYSGTLVNAIMYHCGDHLSGINGVMRPGIVHRIDMDTTGLLCVCKNDLAHQSLADQLKVHSITRKYEAIVYNTIKEDGIVNAPIGRHPVDRKKMAINHKNGKEAITHYHVIKQLKNQCSYIECQLETGRTHQIRVHMASIGHPLLGDLVYGPQKNPYHLDGQALHAKVFGFIHPSTGEYMEFEAPTPEYFQNLITKLSE